MFESNPALRRLRLEKYPEEYAIAFPGVAIIKINAKPPLRATNNADNSGLIEGISFANAIPMGKRTATAPTLDMILVSSIVMSINPKITKIGLLPTMEKIF